MAELRQKVMTGTIKPIAAGKYSTELVLVMQSLLQTTPSKRATIDKILASPAVQKRLGASKPAAGPASAESHVIGTIKVVPCFLDHSSLFPLLSHLLSEGSQRFLEMAAGSAVASLECLLHPFPFMQCFLKERRNLSICSNTVNSHAPPCQSLECQ